MKRFTIKEIADMHNVHVETVRRWIRTGKLKAHKTSNKRGYYIEEVDLLMNDIGKYNRKHDDLSLVMNEVINEHLRMYLDELIELRDAIDSSISKIKSMIDGESN